MVTTSSTFSTVPPRDDETEAPWQLPRRNEYDDVDDYYYYSASRQELGIPNPDAAAGNPLKGLFGSPWYPNYFYNNNETNGSAATNTNSRSSTTRSRYPSSNPTSISASLEWYYLGLDTLMMNDPDEVGVDAAFDWTVLETILNESASRSMHAVLSVMCHYPGKPLNVPSYLLNGTTTTNTSTQTRPSLTLQYYADFLGGGYSPDNGDPILLRALQQFIEAFGARYDGDTRIGFLHLGLLGFWGEWHTYPYDWVPDFARQNVVEWYRAGFRQTQLLTRYPYEPAYRAGIGLSDGSFSYNTVDGVSNGGINHTYYFWSLVESANQTNIWRTGPMSGETRPEIQSVVFASNYPAGTMERQDFMLCVNTTHASFIFHHDAFARQYKDDELNTALFAHTRMGYNFVVSSVDVFVDVVAVVTTIDNEDEGPINSNSNNNTVSFDVTVEQTGVAPFYYPLALELSCQGAIMTLSGVETIIEQGDTKLFSFHGIPAVPQCLNNVSLRLISPYAYQDRPIKFAQGISGKVMLTLPLPTLQDATRDVKVRPVVIIVVAFPILCFAAVLTLLRYVSWRRYRQQRQHRHPNHQGQPPCEQCQEVGSATPIQTEDSTNGDGGDDTEETLPTYRQHDFWTREV